jgi:plastocyanin
VRLRVAIAALALTALSGCSVWGPEGGPGGAGAALPSPVPVVSTADAVAGADGVQRIEVRAGDDLRFVPSVVRARVGTIEFTFRNIGATPHDVRIAGQDTGNLNGDAAATVRLTIAEPGTYPFPCAYHESSGMVGTLIVS